MGVVLALLIAVAALIVAILALTKEPPPAASPSASLSQQGPTADADRELCEAIAPLMKETDDRATRFSGRVNRGRLSKTPRCQSSSSIARW